MVGQAGAGSSRTDQPQGTPSGRPARTGVTLPASASLPAPKPGTTGSITAEDYCEREVDEVERQGGRVYLHLGARRGPEMPLEGAGQVG
jgi:hypothetical protein